MVFFFKLNEERARKAKAIDEQRSPHTSSAVVRVQVVHICEVRTLAGMSGPVIVLDTVPLGNEKEDEC